MVEARLPSTEQRDHAPNLPEPNFEPSIGSRGSESFLLLPAPKLPLPYAPSGARRTLLTSCVRRLIVETRAVRFARAAQEKRGGKDGTFALRAPGRDRF